MNAIFPADFADWTDAQRDEWFTVEARAAYIRECVRPTLTKRFRCAIGIHDGLGRGIRCQWCRRRAP